MTKPVPWLPANAIAAAAAGLPVRAMVSDWAAKWFAQGGASLARYEAITDDVVLTGEVTEPAEGLALATPGDVLSAIGGLMFGEPDEAATAADRAAIDAAAGQACSDLRRCAAQLVGLSHDAEWRVRGAGGAGDGAGSLFTIRVGRTHLAMFVADHLLIAGIKTRLRPVASTRSLGEVADGLAPQVIALSARLGACRLAMGELAALGEGDVVILDRTLSDPATLVVDRVPRPASCSIDVSATYLDLVLV